MNRIEVDIFDINEMNDDLSAETYPIFVVFKSTLCIGLHVSNFPSLFVFATSELNKKRK